MKISHIVNEDLDIDEAIPFTKQWKKDRQAGKDIKADIADMTSDLKTWMSGSGLRNISIDDFKDFLSQKGLDAATADRIAADRTSGRTGTPPDAPLSSVEVKQYIDKAVRAGYKAQGAGLNKSRFARPSAAGSGNPPANSGSGLPNALTSMLTGLTAAQKAALKGML